MQRTNDLSIIGAGIAGLSCAYWAAKAGFKVDIYEKEQQICMHSSGRNAAMFRQVEESKIITQLATESRYYLDQICGKDKWINKCGSLFVCENPIISSQLAENAINNHISHRKMLAGDFVKFYSDLAKRKNFETLYFENDGVMDIHFISQKLYKNCKSMGVRFHFSSIAEGFESEFNLIKSFKVNQHLIKSKHIILANGAWLPQNLNKFKIKHQIKALRRHLYIFESAQKIKPSKDEEKPYIWFLGKEQFYRRQEIKDWLCSPCDESESMAGLPPVNPEQIYQTIEKINNFAPELSSYKQKHVWACLRTFTEDRLPLFKATKSINNLYIHGALGGHGMSIAMATGKRLISTIK